MVTGCDNLLDDEYKPTLETDLPRGGTRFRSVVDIMVSDRVLFEILSRLGETGAIGPQAVRLSAAATLRALAPSGIQESSEEKGIDERLAPAEILTRVHHFKTGMLFQCTWAVPEILGDGSGEKVAALKEGLYRIGMGCQLWDDLVDLAADMRQGRHNYIASLAFHGSDPHPRSALLQMASGRAEPGEVARFLSIHPAIRTQICRLARSFMMEGLEVLFDPAHRFMAAPAADFIAERIGVTRLLAESGSQAAA
jgi:geranylgeranyl pyrophosphate synthase